MNLRRSIVSNFGVKMRKRRVCVTILRMLTGRNIKRREGVKGIDVVKDLVGIQKRRKNYTKLKYFCTS